jgi:hypothetical protein
MADRIQSIAQALKLMSPFSHPLRLAIMHRLEQRRDCLRRMCTPITTGANASPRRFLMEAHRAHREVSGGFLPPPGAALRVPCFLRALFK